VGIRRHLRRLTRPALLGTLGWTAPVSRRFGYDRGTPIDRYYIERFLEANRAAIQGRVLEVKDSGYTDRFGTDVTGRDVLDADASNPFATIVDDLATCDSIPDGSFDCIILTQTLQFIFDTRAALRSLEQVVQRMSVMPGQRTIVMVSGGFLTFADHTSDKSRIMDRAARAGIVVNALDARGLYTDLPDMARRTAGAPQVEQVLQQLEREGSRQQAAVMDEMAAATGGTFVQNTNDVDGGMQRTLALRCIA